MILDGVTQYHLDWKPAPLPACSDLPALNQWRTRFHDLSVIGQCQDRYGGVGFGNVSCRLSPQEFLISGTQTGHLRQLSPTHYCRVIHCDPHANNVHAAGPIAPSSEAMTHHMIYQCDPTARFVIHIHAPTLWHTAAKLGIPITPPEVGYGTPAMADAVAAIIAEQKQSIGAIDEKSDIKEKNEFDTPHCIIAMGGHEDGIIAWSATLEPLGEKLVELLSRAEMNQYE